MTTGRYSRALDLSSPVIDRSEDAPTPTRGSAPPVMGGKVDDMPTEQQSHAVITGPEIHSAGLNAETVSYVLPFGGRLVMRLTQDKRRAGRFRADHPAREAREWHAFTGDRAEVLHLIERYAQFLADRETRRRDGSTEAADHLAPPGNVDGREAWLHLHRCYNAWCDLGQGRRTSGLPDSQVTQIHATNIVGCLPWEEASDYRTPREGVTSEQYLAACRMFAEGWRRQADQWDWSQGRESDAGRRWRQAYLGEGY